MHRSPSITPKDLLLMTTHKVHEKLALTPPIYQNEAGGCVYKCDYTGLEIESAFAFPEAILKGRTPKEPSSRLRGRFLDANCALSWLKEHRNEMVDENYRLAVAYVVDRVAAVHGESTRGAFALAPPAKWLTHLGGNIELADWFKAYKSPRYEVAEIVASQEQKLREVQKAERAEKKRSAEEAAAGGEKPAPPKKSAAKKVKNDDGDAAAPEKRPKMKGAGRKKKDAAPVIAGDMPDSVVAAAAPPPAAPKKKPAAPRKKKAASDEDPMVEAAKKSVVAQPDTKLPSAKKNVRVSLGKAALEGESANFYALTTKSFVGSADAFRAPEYVGLLVMEKNRLTLRPLCGTAKVTVDDVHMAKVAPMELTGLAPQSK